MLVTHRFSSQIPFGGVRVRMDCLVPRAARSDFEVITSNISILVDENIQQVVENKNIVPGLGLRENNCSPLCETQSLRLGVPCLALSCCSAGLSCNNEHS